MVSVALLVVSMFSFGH